MNAWLLLGLLSAHVIGDFYLQSDRHCKGKETLKIRSPFLYLHAAVMGLLAWASAPRADFGRYALLIAGSHLLIDAVKTYAPGGLRTFLADQTAHLAVLCLVACRYVPACRLPLQGIAFPGLPGFPLFAFAALCCMKPANVLIKQVLERYRIGVTLSCRDIRNAGALIGNLERLLTLAFVLAGRYEAVGFIVAAKSLLRFRDTDTAKTEYVLAGTLLSFGLATLCGLVTGYFSRLL